MRKHVYPLVVLVCTLSTHHEGTERTLPDQASRVQLEKQIPGLR
jgi:hypothetical protein